jgi:hypothetical protein
MNGSQVMLTLAVWGETDEFNLISNYSELDL